MKRITKNKQEDKSSGDRISQHFPCISDEIIEDYPSLKCCGSSDAMSVYQHDTEEGTYYDAYCWSCNQVYDNEMLSKSSVANDLGLDDNGKVSKNIKLSKTSKAEPLSIEEVKNLIRSVGYKGKGYRGIKDEFVKYYGCLTKLDSNGEVEARYYPETEDGKITGYTIRKHPKNFKQPRLGKTGMSSDLYGQVRWKKGHGKYVMVCGGQEDCHAALEMFTEYNRSRGQDEYDQFPIVSPTTGEGSAYKQLSAQYDWLDTYDNIYLALDSDKAGKDAIERCLDVLPAEKVHIVTWSGKDPNDMLQKGKQKQFIRDFYNAKPCVSSGIKGSNEIIEELPDFLNTPKLTLPPFMHRLQENMRGGIGFGRIVNIIADSSVGKTTLVNSMVYHWIMHCLDIAKTGVVSLESTSAEYALDMLSMHLGINLQAIPEGGEVLQLLDSPEIKDKYEDLFTTEYGVPRFNIVDEREGKITVVEKQIEQMVKQHGCKVIVIDVLSDLLRSLDNSEQEKHMMWQKLMVKRGIIIVNVLHTRKPPADGQGKQRKATEYDAIGSSSFVQSAHINIVFNRDKMSEDPVERNTTIVDMPKCRGGITGHATDLYYDFKTRELHDLIDYFEGEPPSKKESSAKKKLTKPKKPANIEKDDTPPFKPDNVEEDINPFDGEE